MKVILIKQKERKSKEEIGMNIITYNLNGNL